MLFSDGTASAVPSVFAKRVGRHSRFSADECGKMGLCGKAAGFGDRSDGTIRIAQKTDGGLQTALHQITVRRDAVMPLGEP